MLTGLMADRGFRGLHLPYRDEHAAFTAYETEALSREGCGVVEVEF